MNLQRTSHATPTNVVSVATAKNHLRVDVSDDDTLIETLIGVAYDVVERYTGTFLQEETATVYCDHFTEYMVLPGGVNVRINTTTGDGVGYYDEDGAFKTLASSAYEFDGISIPARLRITDIPDFVDDRLNAVEIDIKAGWNDSGTYKRPAALVQAMLLIVGHLYENRQDVTGFKTHELPMASRYLMDKHRIQQL